MNVRDDLLEVRKPRLRRPVRSDEHPVSFVGTDLLDHEGQKVGRWRKEATEFVAP